MSSMNVWFANDQYHIKHNNRTYRYDDYINAKAKIDSIVQSVYFTGTLTRKAS